MRITLITIGSRGDVQPYVALALALKAAGHDVRLATHAEFEPMIRERGLDFAPMSGSPQVLLGTADGQAWLESGTNPIQFMRLMRRLADAFIHDLVQDGLRAAHDAEALIVSTIGLFIGQMLADKLCLPLIPAPLQPLQPNRSLPSSMFPPLQTGTPLDGLYNRASYFLGREGMWLLFGGVTNRLRRDALHLPTSTSREWMLPPGQTVLYGFSESVVPKPAQWDENAHVCGYWFLDAPTDFVPPSDLVEFIHAGSPPVYVGFGSMKNRDPQASTALVLEALRRTGQRGVLLTGWGGLTDVDLPESVYKLDAIPHDWLFPQMAAVVHHGGIGTTAAGLRAGVPSILTPFFADQPLWGSVVYRLGVGPKPIPNGKLTADKLARAIDQAVGDSAMRARAAALGEKIRSEDGTGRAVAAFEAAMATLADAKVHGARHLAGRSYRANPCDPAET